MKHTNMRKILAVLMSAVMLLGLLAGCNNAGNAETGATEDTSTMANPIASGMLVVNANGTVNVSYDSDGLVLNLEGADDNGNELVAEYPDFLGEPCAEVVCTLIKNSSVAGYLAESNYVMIKQAVGSQLPGTNFLEELTTDAKAALETVKSSALLLVLGEEDLDENGYINLESAKELSLAYLKLDAFDSFDGSTAPVNGTYGFNITAGALDEDLLVDAVTGSVYPGVLNTNEDEENLDAGEDVGTEPVTDDENTEVIATEPATDPTADSSNEQPEASEGATNEEA